MSYNESRELAVADAAKAIRAVEDGAYVEFEGRSQVKLDGCFTPDQLREIAKITDAFHKNWPRSA